VKRALVEQDRLAGLLLLGETAAGPWLRELMLDGAQAKGLRRWLFLPAASPPAGFQRPSQPRRLQLRGRLRVRDRGRHRRGRPQPGNPSRPPRLRRRLRRLPSRDQAAAGGAGTAREL